MKTYQVKQKDVKRQVYELDASSMALGRLASKAAVLLMGKHKPDYTQHIDVGDSVIIKNSNKLILTGKKSSQKIYQKHSGYPGGFKEIKAEKLIKEHPSRIIEMAVARMLPDNRLRSARMRRLKIT